MTETPQQRYERLAKSFDFNMKIKLLGQSFRNAYESRDREMLERALKDLAGLDPIAIRDT